MTRDEIKQELNRFYRESGFEDRLLSNTLAYLNDLEIENNSLKHHIKKLEESLFDKEGKNKIDKAIKFIEDRMIIEHAFCLDMKQCSELIGVLKDSDVDE